MTDEILRQAQNLSSKSSSSAAGAIGSSAPTQNTFKIEFFDKSSIANDLSVLSTQCRDIWVDLHKRQLHCSFDHPLTNGGKFINDLTLWLDAKIVETDDNGNVVSELEIEQMMTNDHMYDLALASPCCGLHNVKWDFVSFTAS
jgi:hypothetical protein